MKKKNVICCFGDSTTQGSSVATVAYPARLQKTLGYEWNCFNHGFGGNTASQIATRIGYNASKFTSMPRRIATVMGGINDIIGGTSAATTYSTLLGGVTALLSGGWEHVVWLTPSPCVPYGGLSAGELIELHSLCSSILAYSNASVTTFDTYSMLEDAVTADQLSYLGGGGKPDYATSSVSPYGRDWLHYNNAAHSAIAAALAPIIQAL